MRPTRNRSLQLARISIWSMKAGKEKGEAEEGQDLYPRARLKSVAAYA
jgi:hypothetical protein